MERKAVINSWRGTPFVQRMAKTLLFLMVFQTWPLWDLSQSYERTLDKLPRTLNRIISFLNGPIAQAGGITVFGPRKYLRTTGNPNIYKESFSVAAGKGTLLVVSGEADGSHRVSSAIITLNGKGIFGTKDFNQNVYHLSKPIDLLTENQLVVELRSKPDSFLIIEITVGQQNTPPVAEAGPGQTVFVGTMVTLDGSKSSDVDGDSLTYKWSFNSVPGGSVAAFSNPTAVNPTFDVDRFGNYVVQLIVNDSMADSAPDTVVISTLNSPPVANAGPDQTSYVNNTVALNGSASTDVDGNLLSFNWSFVSRPEGSAATLSDPTTPNPTFVVDRFGSFTIQLIVDDGTADSAPDTVVISTLNSAPVANAGPDQTIHAIGLVTLNGSVSSDVDGNALTYAWSLVSRPEGSTAALSDRTIVNPTFFADEEGSYVIQLVVNDGALNSAPVTVTITTRNSRPVADAGPDQAVHVNASVNLSGLGSSDADGDTLSYTWSFTTIPVGSNTTLANANTPNASFVADRAGTYVVQLMVDDGWATAMDTVTVEVSAMPNAPPVANAGPDQSAFVNNTVILDGNGSYDANGDPLTYNWSLMSAPVGSEALLSDSTIIGPTFVIDRPGSYTAQLIVNDGMVDSAPDTVAITTLNSTPVANAGPDQSAYVTNTVTLNGSGSSDVDGDSLTYAWVFVSIPSGSTAALSTPGAVNPSFAADLAGTYVLQLVVNDGRADSVPDSVRIDVNPAPGCLEGTTQPCSSVCGAGVETCLGGQWQACSARLPSVEVCDGVDNNCDGNIDEGVTSTFYADTDGDGFGDPNSFVQACTPPPGYVTNNLDCDDTKTSVHPGALEIADNGIDEDCNGVDLSGGFGDGTAEWFVAWDAPPGGDGRSWATAFRGIQEAVSAASEGNEIWVKAGTYPLTATIMVGKKVHIYGGFAGNESLRGQRDIRNNVTTINGEYFNGTGLRLTADATFDGFTVAKCYGQQGALVIENASPRVSRCTFSRNRALTGGAIDIRNASPTITECLFTDNTGSADGGAISIRGQLSPVISQCEFTGNTGRDGGAIYIYESSPLITQCTFKGNFADYGSAILMRERSLATISDSLFIGHWGGTDVITVGVFIYGDTDGDNSAPLITRCTFLGNNATAVGVSASLSPDPQPTISDSLFMSNYNYRSPAVSTSGTYATITDSRFIRNSARDCGAIHNGEAGAVMTITDSLFMENRSNFNGGAICNQRGTSYIVNSLFIGNSAENQGGAVYSYYYSGATILFSNFIGNRVTDQSGAALYGERSSPTVVRNSIFRENVPIIARRGDIYSSLDITYSITPPGDVISSGPTRNYNIDADPLFRDPARGDFRLLAGSPTIDMGTTDLPVPPGLPATDAAGASRVVDGDGNGTPQPDLGAYEYVPGGYPPVDPPSNRAPVAFADARVDDQFMMKDFRTLRTYFVGDTVELDGSRSTDPEGGTLSYTWSFVYRPTGSAAVFSDPQAAAPTFVIDRGGTYVVQLVVNDGMADSDPDFVVLRNENRQPVFNAGPDQTVNAGDTVQLNGELSHDPDGDYLTFIWEFTSRPSGSPVSTLVGPRPTFVPDRPGVYVVRLSLFDIGRWTLTETATIYAQRPGNTPPWFNSTPVTGAIASQPYSYQVRAQDNESRVVTYTLDVAPAGMNLSSYYPGLIQWLPTPNQVGQHTVIVRAVDEEAGYSFQQFTVTVTENHPPVITSTPPLSAWDGTLYTYDVEATDPDPGDTLTYFVNSSFPNITIDPVTGLLQWTPTLAQIGDQEVTVVVRDQNGFSASQTFHISVLELNRPPQIISVPPRTATEGLTYGYQVMAGDPNAVDLLTFSLSSAPDGMTVDPAQGLIAWTPNASQIGVHNILLRVTDTRGLATSQEYTVTVQSRANVDLDGDSYSPNGGDCNDSDPLIHPGVLDIAGNGIDEDCSGSDAGSSIQVKAGQVSVSILPGSPRQLSYTIDFRTTDTNQYHVQFSQRVVPDDCTLSAETTFPAILTANGSVSWDLKTTVTCSGPGTYEVIIEAAVIETGQTHNARTKVKVTSGVSVPFLYALGSSPDAISVAFPNDVTFTTTLTGTKTQPSEIIVEEVDATGQVIRTVGSLNDNGLQGDLQAGDYVYSGSFTLMSFEEGFLRFRARALFPGMAAPIYSGESKLQVTRFPTWINAAPASSILVDMARGLSILSNRILVSFVEGTSPGTIQSIIHSINGGIIGAIYRIGVYRVVIPGTGDVQGINTAIDTLKARPEVKFAEPVAVGFLSGFVPNDPLYTKQSALPIVRADEAWVNAQGGPVIAVIDTGVDYTHPDLQGIVDPIGPNYGPSIWQGGFDPFESDPGPDGHCTPRHCPVGHGTHVAGIAAGAAYNGIGIAGMTGRAWDSKILAVRAADLPRPGNYPWDLRSFSADNIAAGIVYSADRGAKIINVSSGIYQRGGYAIEGSVFNALEAAVVYATSQKGSLVIGAAGNFNLYSTEVGGEWSPEYPGAFPQAIAVGGVTLDPGTGEIVRWNENPMSGTNYGPWVDISAPSERIFSTVPGWTAGRTGVECYLDSGCYTAMSGTSFATPLVSGAAALVWKKYPEWNADQVRERLLYTATPLPGLNLGAGTLDVFEAVFNGSFEYTNTVNDWLRDSLFSGQLYYWDLGGPVLSGFTPTFRDPVYLIPDYLAGFPLGTETEWYFLGYEYQKPAIDEPGIHTVSLFSGGGFTSQFGPIVPKHGNQMAYIATGRPGETLDFVSEGCHTHPCLWASVMEQRFRIQPGQTEIPISLFYEFVSAELPGNSYMGDGFQISLQINRGHTIDSIQVLAHGHTMEMGGQMTELPATPPASFPSGSSPLYHTGWKVVTARIPLSAEVSVAGGMGTLRFTVFDDYFYEIIPGFFSWRTDAGTDSALFIDGIQFKVDD